MNPILTRYRDSLQYIQRIVPPQWIRMHNRERPRNTQVEFSGALTTIPICPFPREREEEGKYHGERIFADLLRSI